MKHMKHMVLSIIITMLTFSLVACSTEHPSSSPDQQKEEPFTYIGVYTWDPVVDFYDFFKACGINTIQLSERSWFYDASAENFENFYSGYWNWLLKKKEKILLLSVFPDFVFVNIKRNFNYEIF